MVNLLVTGANGQLGQSLQHIASHYPEFNFTFCNSKDLDITNVLSIKAAFKKHRPDYCINTAAYTAVDKAESEPLKAYAVNVTGAANLAEACKANHVVLLHVSTDFVFDGNKTEPYTEEDLPAPTGVYGETKLDGERAIQAIWEKHYIVRTSWVYSQFGNNFMKTMLRLGAERESLSVVDDQIGTPTNAVDLAEALISIVKYHRAHSGQEHYGLYNFSNEGQCSWYDFAAEIFRINKIGIDLRPIPTSEYPTPARRPVYSILSKYKIKNAFSLEIGDWAERLQEVLFLYNSAG